MVFRVDSENPVLRVHADSALLIRVINRRLTIRGKLFIIQTCASFQQTVHVNGRGLLFCDFLIDLRQLVPVQEDGPGPRLLFPLDILNNFHNRFRGRRLNGLLAEHIADDCGSVLICLSVDSVDINRPWEVQRIDPIPRLLFGLLLDGLDFSGAGFRGYRGLCLRARVPEYRIRNASQTAQRRAHKEIVASLNRVKLCIWVNSGFLQRRLQNGLRHFFKALSESRQRSPSSRSLCRARHDLHGLLLTETGDKPGSNPVRHANAEHLPERSGDIGNLFSDSRQRAGTQGINSPVREISARFFACDGRAASGTEEHRSQRGTASGQKSRDIVHTHL